MPVPETRRAGNGKALELRGVRAHNLKNVDVRLPLGMLVAVTGPSGSGKSTLMLDVLDRAARRHFYRAGDVPGAHDRIDGWEHLDKIVTIDQRPISRLPRSNAATYTDAFAPIREAFAAASDGLTPGHFSFNVPGVDGANAAAEPVSSWCPCTSSRPSRSTARTATATVSAATSSR